MSNMIYVSYMSYYLQYVFSDYDQNYLKIYQSYKGLFEFFEKLQNNLNVIYH